MDPYIARMISGCLGSCIISILAYPLDTIKTLTHLKKKNTIIKLSSKQLYKGIKYDLMSEAISSLFFFSVYEKLKEHKNVAYGAFYGATCCSVIKTPFEYLKVHGQLNILKNRPKLGVMFRHYPITLMKAVPTQIVTFSSVEAMKIFFSKEFPNQTMPLSLTILSGFIAGSLSCIVNNPLDVLKTNVIAHNSFKKGINNMVSVGVTSMYLGLRYKFLTTGMNVSIGYTIYENISNILINL